jgi:hypothetical protein
VPGATAEELLEAAARGRVGVDRRFVHAIVDQGSEAAGGVLRFARDLRENDRIELDPLLIDLFRHFETPEALEFYMDAIRRAPEDVDDSLIQALLPFGAKAIEPLLALYNELGEEQGSDIAFLLAGLRVHDPRVFQVLIDRLEYDAADGAFCLGLYGDAAARPALEKMLAEIPESDAELRRDIARAIEQLDEPEPQYQREPFDIFAEYPERELPPFDVLDEAERMEMLASGEADVRAGAAHSFFNQTLNAKSRAALLDVAKNDTDPSVRGEAWAALGDATEDATIRGAMIAVLNDTSTPVEERGGAGVGLYAVADQDEVRNGLEALYEQGGKARIKALEAMWRSLYPPYAKYFPAHLDETDPKLLRQAIRGAGYFRLTRYADKIASFFDREEPFDDLREDALFSYALAMPGETTRGRARGMLRKIDALTPLSSAETELVKFALDERLRMHGLAPVFEGAEEEREEDAQAEPAGAAQPQAPVPQKIGRNDPCPCGSGKKYKKCHGA